MYFTIHAQYKPARNALMVVLTFKTVLETETRGGGGERQVVTAAAVAVCSLALAFRCVWLVQSGSGSGCTYFYFQNKLPPTRLDGFNLGRRIGFPREIIILSHLNLQKNTTKRRGVPSLAASCLLASCIYLETFCGTDRHSNRLVQV